MSKLVSAVNNVRSLYNADKNPQAGKINNLEQRLNEGKFSAKDVGAAIASGHVTRGTSQSYYVVLVDAK